MNAKHVLQSTYVFVQKKNQRNCRIENKEYDYYYN